MMTPVPESLCDYDVVRTKHTFCPKIFLKTSSFPSTFVLFFSVLINTRVPLRKVNFTLGCLIMMIGLTGIDVNFCENS